MQNICQPKKYWWTVLKSFGCSASCLTARLNRTEQRDRNQNRGGKERDKSSSVHGSWWKMKTQIWLIPLTCKIMHPNSLSVDSTRKIRFYYVTKWKSPQQNAPFYSINTQETYCNQRYDRNVLSLAEHDCFRKAVSNACALLKSTFHNEKGCRLVWIFLPRRFCCS